mgnify:CR=1 FL=1
MRIKQIKNDKINSFEFSYDLSKGDYLKKILELYLIDEVYICIYGLGDKKIFDKIQTKIEIKKFSLLSSCKSLQNFVLNISLDEISNLLSIIDNSFDELVVWDPYTNWGDFIKSFNEPPFLTFSKASKKDDTDFYLIFKKSDFNNVEIISNLSFHNSKNINKGELIKIFN